MAATKIQSGYKGMKTRKEIKARKKENEETVEQNVTAQEAEEEIDIDMDDPETAKAATKIQASFRGSQSRKEVKNMKDKEEIVKQTVPAQETTSFDPNDPEVNEAATTIQAGYRGMKTRHTRQNEK